MRRRQGFGLIALGFAAAILPTLASCDNELRGGPIDGVVRDDTTMTPIANAIVVASWHGNRGGPFDSHSEYFHIETAVSDANGRFNIRKWSAPGPGGTFGQMRDNGYFTWAYAPGYEWSFKPGPSVDVVLLHSFGGTEEERLRFLLRIANQRGGEDDGSHRNLIPAFGAVLVEARALAAPQNAFTVQVIEGELRDLCTNWRGHDIGYKYEEGPNDALVQQITLPSSVCQKEQRGTP